MIDSDPIPKALIRDFHYQFVPAGYSTEYETAAGIIPFGQGRRSMFSSSIPFLVTPTTTGTIPYFEGERFKEGWIIILYAGTEGSPVNMTARVTSSNEESFTFQAYEAKGSGTHSFWTIITQWENAENYIQNPVYSAKEISSRNFTPVTAEFLWPVGGSSETVVTSDTDLYKAGYTNVTYGGRTIVVEDENDINRPYVGVTVSYSNEFTTTTTVTTWNYAVNPPEEIITITVDKTTITHSHTYGEGSFNVTDDGYQPGLPAVYEDGNLVSFPTPSSCIKDIDSLGSYESYKYDNYFEEYEQGLYRPTTSTIIVRQIGGIKDVSPINPASFFHPG